ncbi:MAG: hypothetical protein RIR70_645 [Pseudomonadota bacterium]|jgi:two-component system response regulator BaeR
MSEEKRCVLVVEDDEKIARMLCDYLEANGYAASRVANGIEAVRRIEAAPPAAVLLDLMLPGLDGLEVCRVVRKKSDVPIIMITARVEEVDRLLGLEIGADDYVCKPFSPREVIARLRALIRRSEGRMAGNLPTQGWAIDDASQRIHFNRQMLALTPIEFRLLRTLLGKPGRVFSRGQLLDCLHDDFTDTSERAIDSHIKNLRRKMEAVGAEPTLLASVYGAGYRFDMPQE